MEISKSKNTVTLFCGGDVNLGRRTNYLVNIKEPFVGIDEMASADCRLVNLECVIGTHGEQNSVRHYFYLRARPEQTNILTRYNIDIVTTANNHAGDYGLESLMEQNGYLDEAGILHAGSGKNFEEAIQPVYKKVGDIVLAIFSVDSRRLRSAAGDNTPGTAYIPLNRPDLWKEILSGRISKAHEKADVVIVCPHWGTNLVYEPSNEQQVLGKLLIDIGADAVFGTHAHYFQGVENYKDRPIIYDGGDFLFDSGKKRSACGFVLKISKDGVEEVKFVPLFKTAGQTLRTDGEQALQTGREFIALCKSFKTATRLFKDGTVKISFNPPPRKSKITEVFEDVKREKRLIKPLKEPRPEWLVEKVPDEAIISPKNLGPLNLVGFYVPPECRTLTKPRMIYVETYWTVDKPVEENYSLEITGVPVKKCSMPSYGKSYRKHEFIDHMWPVTRWKPGIIYHEKIGLLPPRDESVLLNVDLQLEAKVTAGKEILGKFKDPNLIKMQLKGFPYI